VLMLAFAWISSEITTRAFGKSIVEFVGSWGLPFLISLLALSLLIIYAVKRIGGLEE